MLHLKSFEVLHSDSLFCSELRPLTSLSCKKAHAPSSTCTPSFTCRKKSPMPEPAHDAHLRVRARSSSYNTHINLRCSHHGRSFHIWALTIRSCAFYFAPLIKEDDLSSLSGCHASAYYFALRFSDVACLNPNHSFSNVVDVSSSKPQSSHTRLVPSETSQVPPSMQMLLCRIIYSINKNKVWQVTSKDESHHKSFQSGHNDPESAAPGPQLWISCFIM